MNKILLILVIVLMVFSCQQAKKENIDNKEKDSTEVKEKEEE